MTNTRDVIYERSGYLIISQLAKIPSKIETCVRMEIKLVRNFARSFCLSAEFGICIYHYSLHIIDPLVSNLKQYIQ